MNHSYFGKRWILSSFLLFSITVLLTGCEERKVTFMKKNIGSALALYPAPTVVVGAMNGDKPTWTLVGHVGIIGHDKILVSLASAH